MADNSVTPEELKLLIEQTYKVEEEYIALRTSYSSLQDTVENVVEFLPNAIWVLNEDGKVFLQNSRADGLSHLLEVLDRENNDYEVQFENSSYLIKSSHYKDKQLISATDITEQKRKENLATMGQMAAHLAHEIRNPIGSISLLTSTLKNRVIPENVEIVDEIQKSIYRIERIIKATLMFSKGVKAVQEPLRWSSIQEELSTALSYYAYGKEIQIKLLENDFILYADKELLVMLFTNFIFNAIDAIELDDEDEGVIEFVYESSDTHHIFKIYDSGVPIDNKEELFEAFKSTKEKGNGLGLVLARQIAQAHGGNVQLCSETRKGFMITLSKESI